MSEQKMREALERLRSLYPSVEEMEGDLDLYSVTEIDCVALADLAIAQQPVELTDEELIKSALDSGFERNTLGWTFTYGKLDYHLLKFARALIAAHEAKKAGGVV